MKVPPDVLEVLADPRLVVGGNNIQIPWELSKRLYEMTNKTLKAAGGTWNSAKKVRAHVFPADVDAADLVRQIVLSGELVSGSDLGWFPTPPPVVHRMLEHAGIRPGMTVLEPSAGIGSIAGPAAGRGGVVDCVELDERRASVLEERCGARLVHRGDFLTCVKPLDYAQGFQRVLMNPPFRSALAHVNHALGFLGDDALLVAVMSASITWSKDQDSRDFRQLVDLNDGEIIRLDHDAFKPAGTTWPAVLAVIPTGHDGCTVRNHSWHLAQPKQLGLFAA
ncbi:hypothetical protein AB0F88_17175 [Streptosporangium sp. NPDC023963]|uniref:hypothetical protein n=1 Tax=Streptosporangium sp. NPDC023963 TaxID=3155608 RepID=UPI0034256808